MTVAAAGPMDPEPRRCAVRRRRGHAAKFCYTVCSAASERRVTKAGDRNGVQKFKGTYCSDNAHEERRKGPHRGVCGAVVERRCVVQGEGGGNENEGRGDEGMDEREESGSVSLGRRD